MANVFIQDSTMTEIANAIRTKGGTTASLLPSQMATAIGNIETGGSGGEPTTGDYLVQFIGYRGEVYQTGKYNTGDVVSFPSEPNHDGLIFQGWSSPVDFENNQVVVTNQDLTIGAMFDTVSGATEIDITLTNVTGTTVTLQNITNVTLIEWGDGTTSTELGSHTYDSIGEYTILIRGEGIVFNAFIFGQTNSVHNKYCTEIRLSANSTITSNNVFRNCSSLVTLTIPSNTYSIGAYSLSGCYSLTTVVIPNNVDFIGNNVFPNCYSLETVVIPKDVTTIGNTCFQGCYSLTSITLPNCLENIGSNAFGNCYTLTSYDFTAYTLSDTVPTLSNTNAFSGINARCKMYFSDQATLDNFANATNWSTYADYMYVKEVTE